MKQDITAEKKLFDEIRYLAEFDLLTNLPNRVQFQSTFERLCATEASRQSVALFLIDLDGFKQVNDRLGHQAGDQCLRVAANCLRSVLGGAELVARIGGDEFAVLLRAPVDLRALAECGRRIVAALSRPIPYRGQMVRIGASVGIALEVKTGIATGGSRTRLFERADAALYAAKDAGGNAVRIAVGSG
jgi:diguanylate cyclase (GGDEF)-like protein